MSFRRQKKTKQKQRAHHEKQQHNNMTDGKKEQNKFVLDAKFFRRFKKCLGILFPAALSDSSLLITILLGLSIGQQLVIFNVGLLPSDFMEVLGNKDKKELKSLLVKAFTLIITISVFNSACKALSSRLHVHWRNVLTRFLQKRYLEDNKHYLIASGLLPVKIDNADQRIAQDVDRFCLSLSDIIGKITISPLVIIYYSYKCFNVAGATGPMIIYVYFLIGTFMNKIIMSFIVNMVYTQEMKEGDFRFKHVQVRSLSESIAFSGSERTELFKLSQYLKELLRIQNRIVNTEILLNLSTNFIDYVGSVISYVIISVPIFAGKYNNLTPVELSGVISKNAFVSMYLISCFSTLVDLSSKFTDMSGYAHRIGELVEALETEEIDSKKQMKQLCHYIHHNDKLTLCEISNLTYTFPNSDEVILSNLNINIYSQRNILIMGNTGVGKTSLFRVIKKLWKPITGSIKINLNLKRNLSVMFVPQIPLLTNGSLLEQVIYPLLKKNVEENVCKHEVLKVLGDVGLSHLINRIGGLDVDPCWNWPQRLSPGEIQRLSFARLFYHKPKLAFLDEVTSSIGVSEEECFYHYCTQLGITYVSIGHRNTLKQFHQSYLKIKEHGTWEFGDF